MSISKKNLSTIRETWRDFLEVFSLFAFISLIAIILSGMRTYFWSADSEIVAILIFAATYLFLRYDKLNKRSTAKLFIERFCEGSFIVTLFLLSVVNIPFFEWRWLPEYTNAFLIAVTILTGNIFFRTIQKNVLSELKKQRTEQARKEKEGDQAFSGKKSFFLGIPLIGRFLRFLYKEGPYFALGMAAVVVWGAVLRLYNIQAQSLWIDEITSSVAVNSILRRGVPIFESGLPYTRDLLVHYYLAFIKLIFVSDTNYLRIGTALFGIGLIPLIYLFAKRIYNSNIAMISAFIMSCLAFQISWSRQIRFYVILEFLSLLCIYLFFRLINDRKFSGKTLIASITIFLLSVASGFQGVFLLLPVFLGLLFANRIRRQIIRYTIKNKKTTLIIAVFFLSILFTGTFWIAIRELLEAFFAGTNNLSEYGKLIDRYILSFSILFTVSALTTLHLQQRFHRILNASLFILIIIGVFFWQAPYLRFFLMFFPFIILNIALFIYVLMIHQKFKILKVLTIGFFIFFLWNDLIFVPRTNYQFQEPRTNFDLAYQCVYDRMNTNDRIISITTGGTPPYYYLKDKFDLDNNYVLSFAINKYYEDYRAYWEDDQMKEGYLDINIISDPEQFEKALMNSSGYVVFDQQKIYHVDDAGRSLLRKMVLLEECSDESIRVYAWKDLNAERPLNHKGS